ncbi:MAG: DnaA/Hda family protein, partial [Candidatus Dojkabacteria bacterium]|nr:DnaA/Hda family protein [Candidatus Dojkabacteria bacterium]
MDKNAVWKKTLAQIEIKLDSPAQFKTWFRDTRLIEIEGKNATIGVKNSYTADWLNQKHKNLIQKTLSFVYGKDLNPFFKYDRELVKDAPKEMEKDNSAPILQVKDGIDEDSYQKIRNSSLNERYTFANYVVGDSNRLAHAAALSVSENPGKSYNPLFLYGSTGIGKTHLAQAIGREIIDRDATRKVLYCTTENFLNDMVSCIRSNTMDKFRDK